MAGRGTNRWNPGWIGQTGLVSLMLPPSVLFRRSPLTSIPLPEGNITSLRTEWSEVHKPSACALRSRRLCTIQLFEMETTKLWQKFAKDFKIVLTACQKIHQYSHSHPIPAGPCTNIFLAGRH